MENQKSYALRNKAKFLKKIVVSPKVQYNKTQSAAYDRKAAIARNTRVYLCDFIISQKKGRKRFMQYREQIEAYLDAHKEEMLADICRLIRINSTKGEAVIDCPFGEGPAKALAEALEMAEGYGFTVKNYENYVGTADLNDMEKQLDILAHLDVVPAGDGWSVTEPYMPVIKDGRVYGRGSADDKGPAIAAMYAMRAVKELGIPLNKNVRLILGTDEECGSSDIAHYYAVEKEAPMTFSPDADFPVINIEKGSLNGHFVAKWDTEEVSPRILSVSGGKIVNIVPGKATASVVGLGSAEILEKAEQVQKKTGVVFTCEESEGTVIIHAEGEGAHASKPEEGKNALTALLELLCMLPFAACSTTDAVEKLHRMFPSGDHQAEALGINLEDELSGKLTMNFSVLELNEDGLDGIFDSRIPICGTTENVLNVVKERMEEDGITLLNETQNPPHHVPADSPLVQTLLACYEEYTGQKGECLAIGGGTYVHHLERGVAFGCSMPGTDNRMHGADEFAVVDELVLSAKIFAQVICELCC